MKDNKKAAREEIPARDQSGQTQGKPAPLAASDQETLATNAEEPPSDPVDTNEGSEEPGDAGGYQQPNDNPAAPDIETVIAEAEQRGYLRGRNERIEELMQRPGILERPGNGELHTAEAKADNGFLSHLKISIWDR